MGAAAGAGPDLGCAGGEGICSGPGSGPKLGLTPSVHSYLTGISGMATPQLHGPKEVSRHSNARGRILLRGLVCCAAGAPALPGRIVRGPVVCKRSALV